MGVVGFDPCLSGALRLDKKKSSTPIHGWPPRHSRVNSPLHQITDILMPACLYYISLVCTHHGQSRWHKCTVGICPFGSLNTFLGVWPQSACLAVCFGLVGACKPTETARARLGELDCLLQQELHTDCVGAPPGKRQHVDDELNTDWLSRRDFASKVQLFQLER